MSNERLKIGIIGANVPLEVINTLLDKFGFEAYYLNHCLKKFQADDNLMHILKERGTEEYARHFLQKNSCPRTSDESYRRTMLETIKSEKIGAIIFNAIKFCDFQPFDFNFLKDELDQNYPMMMIEHEMTSNYEGQVMTRVEAFFEKLTKKNVKSGKKREGRYFVGIDSGSHAAKLVCLNREGEIVAKEVVPTGTSVEKSVSLLMERLESVHKIKREEISRIIGTGYGRNKIEAADDMVTEITCHALGAHRMIKKGGTIIDIGGQDSKAIRFDDEGNVIRFAMNDKCAAGTGRFLEVMAAKLEMSLEEFASLACNADSSVPISSMCSVFAESEVISLIAAGHTKESISKGIHKAIAERTIGLARRIDGKPPYYMTGGVAKNKGLVRELEAVLNDRLEVVEMPQFSGALGAAIKGME